MTKDVDVESRPTSRGRVRWFALGAVIVAVAAALALRGLSGGGSESTLEQQLATRVTTILEEASLEEHAEHGHHFHEEEGQVLCAAETFGYEPENAQTVEEVRVVYAHHMCAVTTFPWPYSVRAAGPLAVELTDPPRVILPVEGNNYTEEIRRIIPERYHDVALSTGGFRDERVTEEFRRRLEAAS